MGSHASTSARRKLPSIGWNYLRYLAPKPCRSRYSRGFWWFLRFRTKPLQILFLKLCRKVGKNGCWNGIFWSNSRKKHSKVQLWRFDTWSIAQNDLTCRKTQGDRFFGPQPSGQKSGKWKSGIPMFYWLNLHLCWLAPFFVGLSLLSYDNLRPQIHTLVAWGGDWLYLNIGHLIPKAWFEYVYSLGFRQFPIF